MQVYQFQPGDVLYHKSTNKKCVVIKLNDDGTIKVRTSDNEECDYYPVELKYPESGVVPRRMGPLY